MREVHKRNLKRLLDANIMLTPEAFEYAIKNDFEKIVDELIKENREYEGIVTREFVQQLMVEQELNNTEEKIQIRISSPKRGEGGIAKEIESDVNVLYSPEFIKDNGNTRDFSKYFRSRFEKISTFFHKRKDIEGIAKISDVKETQNEEIGFIAIVSEIRTTKKGNKLLIVEDEKDEINVVIVSKTELFQTKTKYLTEDQVLYFRGKMQKEIFILEELLWPDMPHNPQRKLSKEKISAMYISDVHIGSKLHLEEVFNRVIRFLSGEEQNEKKNAIAQRVKYLIIGGDLVDGVGVYPEQQNELEITSLMKQYEYAAEKLEVLPSHIEVIIIPGNHDATRIAEPQLPIDKQFAEKLYENPNIRMLGSPARVVTHNVEHLLFHGNSLIDIMAKIPEFDVEKSHLCMREMLRNRHLSWIYGNRTPIALSDEDDLVIESIPDVFVTGHTHVNTTMSYKGVRIINSGTMQGQTQYQKKLGINPTPGRVFVSDLDTLKCRQLTFL